MIKRFQSFVTGITVCYTYRQKIKSTEMTEFGLKGTHAMCLFFLHHNKDGLTAAQLTELCAEDKAATSRTVSELQQKGYITDSEKKYRAKLFLTESGVKVASEIDALIEQWVSLGGDGLSEDERQTFYYALEMIAGNLRGKVENFKE